MVVPILLLTFFTVLTNGQTSCIETAGNYTDADTAYISNLNAVISSVTVNINETGFYSASAGQIPNTANAVALCRGDIATDTCRSCLRNATVDLRNACPNRKQAIIWSERCMLRYSNATLFGAAVATTPAWYVWNPNNVTDPDRFEQDLRTLVDGLIAEAASGDDLRKVAGGNVSGPAFQRIFGLVQCTPDLSGEGCSSCLREASQRIPDCCGNRRGGRVLFPSCNLRFETDSFFNESRLREMAAVPPPPGFFPPPQVPP